MYLVTIFYLLFFFFSSRRRHTRLQGDWSSDVCSSDLCFTKAIYLKGVRRTLDSSRESGGPGHEHSDSSGREYSAMSSATNAYGDGKAAKRIVNALLKERSGTELSGCIAAVSFREEA